MKILANNARRRISRESDVAGDLTADLAKDRSRWILRLGGGMFHVEQSLGALDAVLFHVEHWSLCTSVFLAVLFHVEQIILPKGKIGNWFVAGLNFSL